MSSDLEPTKIDYIIRSISKQVYNVFPFVSIKYEGTWNTYIHDICVRWYYNGTECAFKYSLHDDALIHIDDLDSVVNSMVLTICNKIMESCNADDEEESNND